MGIKLRKSDEFKREVEIKSIDGLVYKPQVTFLFLEIEEMQKIQQEGGDPAVLDRVILKWAGWRDVDKKTVKYNDENRGCVLDTPELRDPFMMTYLGAISGSDRADQKNLLTSLMLSRALGGGKKAAIAAKR